ncbi:MAG: dihydropteroate synthase [Oligoflexia bacterium]|nr:dihydropteroate synthase [Oligoflexia bacterium]MBF0364954.1 dihydropteroate synthase [Oligoflexia bacterium]
MNTMLMGVLNITPDSFSDGGELNSSRFLQQKVAMLLQQGAHILDIGAESTAPMNAPLPLSEEFKRFQEVCFPILPTLKLSPQTVISIDTYRPEVFVHVCREFAKYCKVREFYWNDISGELNLQILHEVSQSLQANGNGKGISWKYILSYNAAASRGDRFVGPQHMQFSNADDNVVVAAKNFFQAAKEKLLAATPTSFDLRQLIFDPGLGFAKSREQNLSLSHHLPEIIREHLDVTWCLGFSRKSFLRPLDRVKSREQTVILQSEYLHAHLLARLIALFMQESGTMIFRVHDINVAIGAMRVAENFSEHFRC